MGTVHDARRGVWVCTMCVCVTGPQLVRRSIHKSCNLASPHRRESNMKASSAKGKKGEGPRSRQRSEITGKGQLFPRVRSDSAIHGGACKPLRRDPVLEQDVQFAESAALRLWQTEICPERAEHTRSTLILSAKVLAGQY